MSNQALKQRFKDWACSFSGCEGGNLDGDIWYCGIESGYARGKGTSEENHEIELRQYYQEDLKQEIAKGAVATPTQVPDWQQLLSYQFGQKMAKLYAVFKESQSASAYRDVAPGMCEKIFKMNLYPVAFPYADDALWNKYGLPKITGFDSKYIYRTWCFLHRFPWIHEQVLEHKPRLIITTGVDYLTDFIVCFAGRNGTENIFVENIEPEEEGNQKTRRIYWARLAHDGFLVVIPHFSRPYGLNSDRLIEQVGRRIRDITSPFE